MKTLSIGELALRAGVGVQTVRFYERKGLIAEPPRDESGYRAFPPDTLQRLRFIRNAQKLGFSLREISDLLSLRLIPESACIDVKEKAQEKINEIDGKIKQLKAIRSALKNLTARCAEGPPAAECHFLQVLSEPGASRTSG